MVSTLDSESSDPSSNLGRTYPFTSISVSFHFIFFVFNVYDRGIMECLNSGEF
jgi:hypothetical protein